VVVFDVPTPTETLAPGLFVSSAALSFRAISFRHFPTLVLLQANRQLSQATILIKTRIARHHRLPRRLKRTLLVEASAMLPKSHAKLAAPALPILVEAVVQPAAMMLVRLSYLWRAGHEWSSECSEKFAVLGPDRLPSVVRLKWARLSTFANDRSIQHSAIVVLDPTRTVAVVPTSPVSYIIAGTSLRHSKLQYRRRRLSWPWTRRTRSSRRPRRRFS
jgi:hypothetical protein